MLLSKKCADENECRELELAILKHPGVKDIAVVCQEGSSGELLTVAYVVSDRDLCFDQLQKDLQKAPCIRRPDCFLLVSAIPLRPDGSVDVFALCQLSVVDNRVAQQLERALSGAPGIERVAVVLHSKAAVPVNRDVSQWNIEEPNVGMPGLDKAPMRRRQRKYALQSGQSNKLAVSVGREMEGRCRRPTNLIDAITRSAADHPDEGIYYVQLDGSVRFQSYCSLLDDCQRILTGLHHLGLKPGDRLLLHFDSSVDLIPAFWSCILGGIIPVPVTAASADRLSKTAVDKLVEVWSLLGEPLILASSAILTEVRSRESDLNCDRVRIENIERFRTCAPTKVIHNSNPESLALLLLTSGSTGRPKIVMHSHHTLISQVLGATEVNGFSAQDVSLNWMPLEHVGGLVMFHIRDVILGCRQIHAPTEMFLRDPLLWLDWLDRCRCTVTWAPNFAFALVNDQALRIAERSWDLSNMRCIINGGETIVINTAMRFLQLLSVHGLPRDCMRPAWGMAETASGVTYSDRFRLTGDGLRISRRPVDLGPPIPGISLRIVDSRNKTVCENVPGHLQVKGVSLSLGFYQDLCSTTESFTDDGWFNTGDIGFLRNGRLTVVGRAKDEIIVNGINFPAAVIEAIVDSLAGIVPSYTAACAVRLRATDTDQLAIFFNCRSLATDDIKKVIISIRSRVSSALGIQPNYLIPLPAESIPKTSIGKIQRHQLKASFEQGLFNAITEQVDNLLKDSWSVSGSVYRKVWQQRILRPASATYPMRCLLIFMDREGLGDIIHDDLNRLGVVVVRVEPGKHFGTLSPRHYRLDPTNHEHYRLLFMHLHQDMYEVDEILHLWTYCRDGAASSSLDNLRDVKTVGVYSLLSLLQSHYEFEAKERIIYLTVVSSSCQQVLPEDTIVCEKTMVLGLLQTAPHEISGLTCRHIDLPIVNKSDQAACILREISAPPGDPLVAYRNGKRFVCRLEAINLPATKASGNLFRKRGHYLISGGLGGIGSILAEHLLTRYEARLLVLGRTQLQIDDATTPEEHIRTRTRTAAWRRLQKCGGDILYESVDVCDLDRVREAVARAKCHWKSGLDGVIHLAADYREEALLDETWETFENTITSKIRGALTLQQIVQKEAECIFLGFSSLAGFFGGAMMGAYACANRFLSAFCDNQNRKCGGRYYCFDWSSWSDTGLSTQHLPVLSESRGYLSLQPTRAVNWLTTALASGCHDLLVGLDGRSVAVRCYILHDCHLLQELTAFVVSRHHFPPSVEAVPVVHDRLGRPVNCRFVRLDQLPITGNGQIDRVELAIAAKRAGPLPADRGEPRNEVEVQVARVWREVLGGGQPGTRDTFFALGGDSLRAAQVIARLREYIGVTLTLREFFQHPTVEMCASLIRSRLILPSASPDDRTSPTPMDASSLLDTLKQFNDRQLDQLVIKLDDGRLASKRLDQ